MAQDKNSFLAYADWIYVIEKLSDVQAGQVFKHLLRYVNDQNPEFNDQLLEIVFEPIKQTLKRDLKKYEKIRGKRSKAGKASAEARRLTKENNLEQNQQVLTSVNKSQQALTNSTVSVSDSVSDSENTNNIILSEGQEKLIKSLCEVFGISEQRQFQSYALLINAIRKQITDGNYDWFKTQVNYYFLYKNASGEKLHGFRTFIGDLIEPDKGAWNAENWQKKYNDHKKKSGASKSSNVQPAPVARIGKSSTLKDLIPKK